MRCTFLNHATVSKLVEPLNRQLTHVVHNLAQEVGREAFCQDGRGWIIHVSPDEIVASSNPVPMPPGSSSVCIWFIDKNWRQSNVTEADISLRLDIPTHLLLRPLEKFHVYRIRLHVPEYEQSCEELQVPDNPVYRGYIGITKRHFFKRFKEHRALAQSGGTTTLYRAWGYLCREKLVHYPALQLMGCLSTQDEAYAIEEVLVAAKTLTPLGLNTIPGGMAGIRMMHNLRLLQSDKVTIVERDQALQRVESSDDRSSPCAHYRSGHFRRLPTGQLTWVRSCWVNPTMDVAA